ncbi:MAG TPA: CocE/NonD family hydrolase [Candidatus Polarisedimenticolia bacterium]|nr:CocE/NonD family hydrolase [Candidatus Polarisedimenticolia bacterium]
MIGASAAPRRRRSPGASGWSVVALGTLLATLLAAPPARAAAAGSPSLYKMKIEHTVIPLHDGVRLAADLFMPDGAKPRAKFPAILEYLPYRKDDGGLDRDYLFYSYMVPRGYVCARVDIRGTGQSEGRTPDREYSDQEQQDGMEVIDWLSKQPWSNGNVGEWGISWGGFNSIQMAMRHPPALKAIIAVDASDNLFQDDIHYIDGLMHVDEYEIAMDLHTTLPRAPEFPLDEAVLATRFDNSPWLLMYKKQQRNGAFWKRASLHPDYGRIGIPTFLVGGWYDGYRDSVPRMLQSMKAPVKALIGPWNHTYPHEAVPGPAIEWRRDAVRFWDQWLKGRDTGIMKEPPVTVFVRHWHPPDPGLKEIPGEWRFEDGWPVRRTRMTTFYPTGDHGLAAAPGAPDTHSLKYIPSAGAAAGFWWGELLTDQREADAFSLVYDSPPLKEEVEILGMPQALLSASASAPLANWFARLSDVAPDGTVTQVTGAGQSGAQRESDERPAPLEPGKVYPIAVEMHVTSWVFPPGHRIRLAVSNAVWPMIWPTPYPMTTTLRLGGETSTRLVLPVIPHEDRPRPRFDPPESVPPLPGVRSIGDTWPGEWSTRRDEVRQSTRVEWHGHSATELPWGGETQDERLSYEVADDNPAVSTVRGEVTTEVHLKDRVLTWHGVLDFKSDAQNFYYHYTRSLLKDGLAIRDKSWDETIPRDLQ